MVSSILMMLCAVIFAFMLLYQNAAIYYAASYSASEGAKLWTENREDQLYWHLWENDPKCDQVAKLAKDCLKNTMVATKNCDIVVQHSGFSGNLTVAISCDVKLPFSGIAEFFNNGKALKLKAKAKANVSEPEEYIRNVDYIKELVIASTNNYVDSFNKKNNTGLVHVGKDFSKDVKKKIKNWFMEK